MKKKTCLTYLLEETCGPMDGDMLTSLIDIYCDEEVEKGCEELIMVFDNCK